MARRYGRGCVSAVLAAVAAAGFSACERGGSGGSTTIVQTVAPTSASAAPTSTTPSVSPINDKAKLCHYFDSRGQEIVNATDAYRKLTLKNGWSWTDPEVSAAADHATEVVGKLAPLLASAIGPGAPQDVGDAIRRFVEAVKNFSDAVASRSGADEMNPLNHKYMDALDAANKACGN
ncbi:hypothetical protein [Segniliparus rugosus]|uniref:hypothetical protein n=1 Tax=Segniliparus rugosus TaxID=286804 RepID=UPI0001F04140|nr:hypothetical protein [Segniliparus rugosus]